jgi:hypothetical protein
MADSEPKYWWSGWTRVQELDDTMLYHRYEESEDMAGDFSTFCPVCGKVREDSKAHRLALFIKDERVAIIPKGTSFSRAKNIAKGVPSAYLMAETIDPETERIMYSVKVYPNKPRPLYEFSG